jgi:hypothetical protein
MSAELAALAADPARVADVEPAAIPVLIGEAEALKAALWVRLQAPPAPAPIPTNGKGPDKLLKAEEVAERLGAQRPPGRLSPGRLLAVHPSRGGWDAAFL